MKVYYWEGRYPAGAANVPPPNTLFQKIRELEISDYPNQVIGTPYHSTAEELFQFGVCRVVDDSKFKLMEFVMVLNEIFDGNATCWVFDGDLNMMAVVPLPASSDLTRSEVTHPDTGIDWESEIDRCLKK